jgi:hypothetical protein
MITDSEEENVTEESDVEAKRDATMVLSKVAIPHCLVVLKMHQQRNNGCERLKLSFALANAEKNKRRNLRPTHLYQKLFVGGTISGRPWG